MLYFLTTPIGNLKDISINTLDIFSKCQIIICEDTRVTKRLLSLLSSISSDIFKHSHNFSNKQFFSFHSHNEDSFLDSISLDFFKNDIAFCVDAGMPCISDPGAKLINFARNNNIKYEILNGGNAFSLAFAYSSLQGEFKFISFLPQKSENKKEILKKIKLDIQDSHIIFYESPGRLKDTLESINDLLPNINIFAYKELTKMYFKEYRGIAKHILVELENTKIRGEWCIILESNKNDNEKLLTLNKNDILDLDISNKIKSKLLAKITNINPKEWYKRLENSNKLSIDNI